MANRSTPPVSEPVLLHEPIPTAATQKERKILIFGSTNSVGFHLSDILSSHKIPFRAAVRASTKHQDNLKLLRRMESASDFDVSEVDWERTDTVKDAMKGVERVFLRTPVGKTVEATKVFLQCIKATERAHRIKSLVFLSGLDAEGGGKDLLGREFAEAEKMIIESGINNYTIVRPSFLFSNLLEFNSPAVKNERMILNWTGDAKINIISDEDVASFVLPMLLADNLKEHAGKVYYPTNTNLYTMKDFATFVSTGLGQEIPMKDISLKEFEMILVKMNRPPEVGRIYTDFMKFAREGGFSHTTQDLLKVLGRIPMALEEMVQKNILWFRNIPPTKQTVVSTK